MQLVVTAIGFCTFFVLIPFCLLGRGISYVQLFACETTNWKLFSGCVTIAMLVAGFVHLYFRYIQNTTIEFAGVDLMEWMMTLFCIFVWPRCVHFVVRK